MSLRIQNNVEAFNAQRQLSANSDKLGKAMEKLSSGYRINRACRRRRRPRHQREAAWPDRRPDPGLAQRVGRRLAGADGRGCAERGPLDAPARPRAGRAVQERHAQHERPPRDPVGGQPAQGGDRAHRHGHGVQRHQAAERGSTTGLVPGRRGRRSADHRRDHLDRRLRSRRHVFTLSLGSTHDGHRRDRRRDQQLSAARATFGAVQNRLEHTSATWPPTRRT